MNKSTKFLLASVSPVALAAGWAVLYSAPAHAYISVAPAAIVQTTENFIGASVQANIITPATVSQQRLDPVAFKAYFAYPATGYESGGLVNIANVAYYTPDLVRVGFKDLMVKRVGTMPIDHLLAAALSPVSSAQLQQQNIAEFVLYPSGSASNLASGNSSMSAFTVGANDALANSAPKVATLAPSVGSSYIELGTAYGLEQTWQAYAVKKNDGVRGTQLALAPGGTITAPARSTIATTGA